MPAVRDQWREALSSEDDANRPRKPDENGPDHHNHSQANGGYGDKSKHIQDDTGSACHACRKKKIKCSRQQPCSSCSQLDVECRYDNVRVKPGLRTGAVESMNQRLVALENMFLGQSGLWQQVWGAISDLQAGNSFPEDLRTHENIKEMPSLQESTDTFRRAVLNSSCSAPELSNGGSWYPKGTKRKRTDDDEGHTQRDAGKSSVVQNGPETTDTLPPDHIVNELVDLYFSNIHPWIPILHLKHFREHLIDPDERKTAHPILCAIVSVTARISNNPYFANGDICRDYIKRNREKVILDSMESFSLENLQAQIILAFDTIGSGKGPSTWSIVSSMTRTVEQLQLSVEDEDDTDFAVNPADYFIHRIAILEPATTWVEKEKRRRVFWNVFLMDRFCSIATGWNFSLTSADVRRRLPCEAVIWETGNPLQIPTPFFGVADQAVRGSMNSNISPRFTEAKDGQGSLGGFAYRIEATETLTLVAMFFLKHPMTLGKAHDLQMWMMKFKELDLRLVQWKLLLPQKWQSTSVFDKDGIMDQNLSLAHITHNAAVILLHQSIAYPSHLWQNSHIRLPSASSAETCLAAASEISIIAEQYLYSCTTVVAPQMAFCLFIAGRIYLANAFHYGTDIPLEFSTITDSLLEISRRWNGHLVPTSDEDDNLASKLAIRLLKGRDLGYLNAITEQPSLDLRQTVFSDKEHSGVARQLSVHSQSPNGSSPQVGGGPFNPGMQNSHHDRSIPIIHVPSGETYQLPSTVPDSPQPFSPTSISRQGHWSGRPQGRARNMNMVEQLQMVQHRNSNSDVFLDDGGFTMPMDGGGAVGQEFEDLNVFFQNSFLPGQRVSTFSGDVSNGT